MKLLWVGICLGALVLLFAAMTKSGPVVLMQEDFDTEPDAGLAAALLDDPEISLAEGEGPDGSDAIRVAYVGFEMGSHRVTKIYNLSGKCSSATLSYDVRFDEDFQFVKGGKLHGLSPRKPVTGGQPRMPQGWSARVVFKNQGHAGSYIYDQNPNKRNRLVRYSDEQDFFPGCWHHVDLQVELNDPGIANGWTKVFVDGHLVRELAEANLRREGGPDSLIQRFLFSTFHGGGTPDWAPVDDQGNFTTVYALFDNFLIIEGIREINPAHCRD